MTGEALGTTGEPVPMGAAEETAGEPVPLGIAATLVASVMAEVALEADVTGAVPLLPPRARMRAAAASAATMTIAWVLPVGKSG